MRRRAKVDPEAFRAAWNDPRMRVEDLCRLFGVSRNCVKETAAWLNCPRKPMLKGAPRQTPNQAPPPDRSALMPVAASVEDAREWLYLEYLRRCGTHEDAEARLALLLPPGIVAETNALRLREGLSPYRVRA